MQLKMEKILKKKCKHLRKNNCSFRLLSVPLPVQTNLLSQYSQYTTSVFQLQAKVAVKVSRGGSSQSRCDTEQSLNKGCGHG